MKILTGDELKEAGTALYGDQWRENLARSLNVDSRRIPQWETGKRAIPVGVTNDLLTLLQENHRRIETLIKKIEDN